MVKEQFILLLFSLTLLSIEGARILAVFPTPSISHQIVFRPLVHELAKRGHNVTVVTTDAVYPKGQTPENLTEIDIRDLSYKMWTDTLSNESFGQKDDIFSQISEIMKVLRILFEKLVPTEDFQNIIKKRNGDYDLLILESCVRPTLALSHIYKVPVIQISSFGGMRYMFDLVGAPTHPLLYPIQHHQRLYNLTNWEKLQQLYYHWWCEYYMNRAEEEESEMLKRVFGGDFPTIRELYSNVDMIFLNVHTVFVDNQPLPPNVQYIGGIYKRPTEKLPQDIQYFLDTSKNGVIYFSFGTNVRPSLVSATKIKMMIKVLSEMPYNVLMKWENESLPGNPKNIKTFKWLSQPDVLKHPNVKLFITQGGLQSTDDAITAGVPLIGIPLLVDQWYNVEKYAHHRIGIKLELTSLTEQKFKRAIETVVTDKSYRQNIMHLRTLLEDEPQKPLERAVWWTEYVLRHGGAKHLRAAGANITWSQYLEFELIAMVLGILVTTVTLCIISITYFMRNMVSSTHTDHLKSKIN